RNRTEIYRQFGSQRRNRRHYSSDFASEIVARYLSRRADPQTRCRPIDRGIYPRNILCLADHGPISRVVGAQMAPGVGAGFNRDGSALFSTRAEGFWIVHPIWFAGAKNLERSHCSIFSILVTQLWVMGAVSAGACWIVRLAHLERPM